MILLQHSLLLDVNVYMRPHKSMLFPTHLINCESFLFTHSDISYRFSGGEKDDVMLEFVESNRIGFITRRLVQCLDFVSNKNGLFSYRDHLVFGYEPRHEKICL